MIVVTAGCVVVVVVVVGGGGGAAAEPVGYPEPAGFADQGQYLVDCS